MMFWICSFCLFVYGFINQKHYDFVTAYFQFGFPIYSAKAVRFRVGHPNVKIDVESDNGLESVAAQARSFCDKIVWTYTSPEFPLVQVINSSGISVSFILISSYP